jgi:hypothetical protein
MSGFGDYGHNYNPENQNPVFTQPHSSMYGNPAQPMNNFYQGNGGFGQPPFMNPENFQQTYG